MDEPTHCSICLTYRQGPCRPYWKKVEACTKDHEVPDKKEGDNEESGSSHEDDENRPDDPPCLKYMMPWIDCASGFRNLYALIEMDTNYTEGIADLEATAANELCWAPQAEPSVDWSAWQDYVELLNPEWKLPKDANVFDDGKQHFWQSLGHSKDPELVQVEAQVPTTLGEGILECAYALDQNGDVIGFAYGTKPSEAAASKDDKDNGDDKKDNNDSGMASMTIRILPTRTRHVVLAASYTHVNEEKRKAAEADKDSKDDGIESHIFKSRPLQLDVVADRNTKILIASFKIHETSATISASALLHKIFVFFVVAMIPNNDVLFGVAIGLGLWFIKTVYSFLKIESCADIQKKALQPIPSLGDDSAITVWGFQKEGEYPAYERGVCDGSPYVARVEVYLRLLKQPYVKKVSVDLSENPRSKLPFANVHGKMVDDSGKIIDAINAAMNKGDPLEELSKEHQTQAHLIRRLLTGSFYWVRYDMNFGTEIGRQAVKDELAHKTLHQCDGTGRMPLCDVVEQGEADLRALTALLWKSKTKYILSTPKPTVIDTDVYAFVSHLFYDTTPSEMDWVVAAKDELPLLVKYIEHMRELLFPELAGDKLKSS
ncbi:MAG: hypothetical protein SGILL_008438 [Bacillariaceae sp.]